MCIFFCIVRSILFPNSKSYKTTAENVSRACVVSICAASLDLPDNIFLRGFEVWNNNTRVVQNISQELQKLLFVAYHLKELIRSDQAIRAKSEQASQFHLNKATVGDTIIYQNCLYMLGGLGKHGYV